MLHQGAGAINEVSCSGELWSVVSILFVVQHNLQQEVIWSLAMTVGTEFIFRKISWRELAGNLHSWWESRWRRIRRLAPTCLALVKPSQHVWRPSNRLTLACFKLTLATSNSLVWNTSSFFGRGFFEYYAMGICCDMLVILLSSRLFIYLFTLLISIPLQSLTLSQPWKYSQVIQTLTNAHFQGSFAHINIQDF